MTDRVLYLKGGRAIEEAEKLFQRVGELPDDGPNKFLLAVLYFSRDGRFRLTSLGPTNARAVVMGHEVIEYGARPVSSAALRRRLSFIGAALRFVWDTLRFRPTRMLCGQHGPFAHFVWLAARLCGAQFVLLAHKALALATTSRAYKTANAFLCRRADLVVIHGPFVRTEAIELGARTERVVEFNNALDAEHIRLVDSLPPKAVDQAALIAIYVGRIEEDKGVFDLLEAFRQVTDVPGLRLRFVGTGSASARLRERIEREGLQSRVELLGAVPFEAVFAHLKQATVAITPSQSRFPEGFCKAAMEAFYVGTPVIAPNYGPFPYLVKHEENGLLYSPDDVDALATGAAAPAARRALACSLDRRRHSSGRPLMFPETTFAAAIARAFPAGQNKLQERVYA